MSNKNETGHTKNMAHFQSLIASCTAMGQQYNPSKKNLAVGALGMQYLAAQNAINTALQAKAGFDNATNTRKEAFEGLTPLTLKIMNALSASEAPAAAVADANEISRKLLGRRAKAKEAPAAPANGTATAPADSPAEPMPKYISVSQQSFDLKAGHLNKLVILLEQQPGYNPNEAELQTKTLRTLADALKVANEQVTTQYVNWYNARVERNRLMYDPTDGLVQVAKDVKAYIISVFGNKSKQHQQVKDLVFKSVK